jgi:hypothetical protein
LRVLKIQVGIPDVRSCLYGAWVTLRRLPQALLCAAVLGACLPPAPPLPPQAPGACDPGHLDACERRLAADPAGDALLTDYVSARRRRGASDPWVQLAQALGAVAAGDAVIVVDGDGPAPRGAGILHVPRLPRPEALEPTALLLALARAAGLPFLIHVRDGAVTQLFPGDALAPFTGGLPPLLRDDGALTTAGADLALARAVQAALTSAGSGRYVEAARSAEAIEAGIAGRDPGTPAVRRARVALQLLGAAGLVLDPVAPREAAATPPVEPLRADETPYGAYLAVLASRDARRAWEAHGAAVRAAFPEDRRADLDALHGRPSDCEAVRPPPLEGPGDLVFASRLAGALARDPAAARPGQLPAAAWLDRYAALVGLVDRTHTAWSFLPALLAERGEAGGLDPAGSAPYQRVTALGLAHLTGLRALRDAEPARFRAFALLGAALAPGMAGDARLQRAVASLTEAGIQGRIAAAEGPEALLGAAATGVIAGLSYPPQLQEAHLGALQGAVTARLRGEMAERTGWSVAALHAADALYRLAAEQRPDLDATAQHVARALAGPELAQPALGALAGAAARYVALAAGGKLDPAITKPEKLPPERRAARAGLRAALAGLGAPGEAPAAVLDDLTELSDGLVATLSAALAEGAAVKRERKRATAPVRAACSPAKAVALDPGTRRALARLGDVRRRILGHPRYKQGDTGWARRARLVVTLLSDAMDLAAASDTGKAPVFAVEAADAERAWRQALEGVGPKGVAAAAAGAYALGRTFAGSRSTEAFVKEGGRELRRLAAGLLELFQGEPGRAPGLGAALLAALAGPDGPGSDDLAGTLVGYAGALAARGERDQADLGWLAALLAGSLTRRPPPPGAAATAEASGSRVAWALRLMGEIRKDPRTGPPDPAAYAEGLRRATDDACQAPDAEATLAVMGAVRAFAAGQRREARDALDGVLARADARGLGVPRMAYRYDEKTSSKVFSVSVEVSYGSGILLDGNSFQLGLGVRSGGAPEGSLTAALAPAGSAKAGEDAARYYVYTAALATVYHLVEGDAPRAVAAGRRAVSALSQGVKLGPRRMRAEKPAAWGEDARELLVVAAQLAAEHGMAFLAGDLWTTVRQGLAETLDDRGVAALLDHPPVGLAGIAELVKPMERARRSLAVLAEPLPCTEARIELGAYEEVGCEAYPLALSLRVADALKKLPRLHRGPETTARCAPRRSLDAFLAGAARGVYDPDAFTRAVEALRAAGDVDDAAVLLARQKRPSHCSVALVAAARALGRTPELGPSLRADLLASAVNCTAATGGAEVDADVAALDEETARLPDPARNLGLILSVADRAAQSDRWETLGKLSDRPDFVGRWMGVSARAAAAALVLDEAMAALRGQEAGPERTKGAYRLLCETAPAAERAEMCAAVTALRQTQGAEARRTAAKEAVKKLVAGAGKGR